jgi:hypothetical protein
MNEDFARRLARLEAKSNVAPADTEVPSPARRPRSAGGASAPNGSGSRPDRRKQIIGAVALLVLLPGTAVFGTITYAKNKDAFDNLARGIGILEVAYVAETDDR